MNMNHRLYTAKVFVLLIAMELAPVTIATATVEHGVTLDVLQEETLERIGAGKYWMRATELSIEPEHFISEPSLGIGAIAYLFEGTVVSSDKGQSERRTTGEALTLSATSDRRYKNAGKDTVRVVVFEVLPISRDNTKPTGDTGRIKLEKEIEVEAGRNKMILVHGRIAKGGFAGEHTHKGNEMRVLLSGSLSMRMYERNEVHQQGDYFFEPANTHMMRVEGDKKRDISFIIFELGPSEDVDAVYHADGR